MNFWVAPCPSSTLSWEFPAVPSLAPHEAAAAARGPSQEELEVGEKLRKWGHAAEKNAFFFSNYDFAACERHRKELWGGLSTNPKKTHPALVIPELTLLGRAGQACRGLSTSEGSGGA